MNGISYITVVLGIVLAKVVGFSRDIFFANFYGTGETADIYFQIFSIVTLVFTGIGVALQTRIIMNLNKEENSGEEKKRAYVASYIRKSFWLLTAATAVLYVFARPLTWLLLPKIPDVPLSLTSLFVPGTAGEVFESAVRLTCIMLPSLIFVSIAYIISGVLQNSRVFFIPSIVSLPYNVIIIASLFIPGVSIETISVVTTIGWFLHIVIQLPSFYAKGYRFLYRSGESVLSSRRTDFSMWWIFISNLMFQLCFIIDKAFVSGDTGMTSTLNYASNLFVTISSVFVVAMSSVVFPAISKNYEKGQIAYVRELIGYIITVMLAVFVPFLLVVSLFGEQIIGLVYERGEFTHESTIATAAAFAIYSFGILGYVAQELINKIFYLASKYIYTIIGTVSVVVLKLVVDYLFVPKYGTNFAAASTTVLLTLYAVMAFTALKSVIGNYLSKNVLINIGKVLLCGAAAVLCYFVLYAVMPGIVTARSIAFIFPIGICGVVYIGTAYVLRLHKVLLRNPGKAKKA